MSVRWRRRCPPTGAGVAAAGGEPTASRSTIPASIPNLALQAAIFAQRQAEYNYKIENYTQKINSLVSAIARANADAAGYRSRLEVATNVEQMRRDLERLQVGSKLNTLAAMDNRAEMERNLHNAEETATGAQRDLAALIAERDGYRAVLARRRRRRSCPTRSASCPTRASR